MTIANVDPRVRNATHAIGIDTRAAPTPTRGRTRNGTYPFPIPPCWNAMAIA